MATFALGWCGGLAMVVIATACIGVMFYPTQLDWRVGSTIIGATTIDQLAEDLDAAQITLDAQTLAEIAVIQQHFPNPAP